MAGLCTTPCCSPGDDAEQQSLAPATRVSQEAEVEESKIEALKLDQIRVEKEGKASGKEDATAPALQPAAPPSPPMPTIDEKQNKEQKQTERDPEEAKEKEALAPKEEPPAGSGQANLKTTTWVYKPVNGKQIEARVSPAIMAEKAGIRLKPGQVFDVSEELRDEQNVLFLKLADGRGWIFDQKPGVGVMCLRKEEADDLERQQQEQQQEEQPSQNVGSPATPTPESQSGKKGCACTIS